MRTNLTSMKKIFFAASAFFIFSQCTEEEIVPNEAKAPAAEAAEVAQIATGSMTISGVYTVYEAIEDCSTCTFVVPADMAIVDGAELDLKEGAVICLDKAIAYGDVEFINLAGTENSPIKIGTCGVK